MLRWVLFGLAGLGGFAMVIALIGWSLPVAHHASRTVTLTADPARVFDAVAGFARYPEWQASTSRVEVSGAPGVGQVVRTHGRMGDIPYRVEVFEPPRRLVMRIEAGLAFGGTWTYDMEPAAGGGSTLTITEDGEIYNVIFRCLARYVFGYHATMDAYLQDLGRHLGQ